LNPSLLLYSQVELVDAGLTEATLNDFEEAHILEFLLIRAYAALGKNLCLQLHLLPGKTVVLFARVFEKHRVVELGADTQVFVREEEVRHLREAVARDKVFAEDLDVARVFSRLAPM